MSDYGDEHLAELVPIDPTLPPPPVVHGGSDATALPAVQITGLTKVYGELRAVDDLHLTIPQGTVYGLIGPNGAGKSTTFSVLASLLKPTSGDVRVLGLDPTSDADSVKARVGYMPDVLGVYDNLRVDEYLKFFANCYRVPRSEWSDLVDGLLELVDLDVKREAMVDSLSRGMKQRLSLARALVHDPDILILDEPASGLDPRARIELRGLLLELAAMGKTLLISSHILSELQEICGEVGILEAGKLLVSGPPREILEQLRGARTIRIRFADGTTQEQQVQSLEEQGNLLHHLIVIEGKQVVEFTEVGGNLEELFMEITQGIVQ